MDPPPLEEKDYQAWKFERTARDRESACWAAAGIWCGCAVLLFLLEVPGKGLALASVGAVLLSIGVVFVVGRARRPSLVTFSILGSNALSGLTGVWLAGRVLDAHASMLGAVVLAAFFQLGFTREKPRHVGLSVAPMMVLGLWLEREAHSRGRATTSQVAVEAFLMVSSYVVALGMAVVADRSLRETHRQERTIEAQRATIERQQLLLEKELSHQVAERSRELGAALAMADVTLAVRNLSPGERFAERYKIRRELGAGGMGVVFEVERVTDGARLALKAVVGEVSSANAARFAREAEIGARVRHRNLVSIVDVGVATGVPYLVMEMVEGGSLEQQRARFGDVAWALELLRQIARGMTALHEAGVVHRDLKPANILLDGDTAKISDFGISRFGAFAGSAVDEHAETVSSTPRHSPKLTGTGVLMGTPLYMAPEAARSARKLDASADVFAFGILAYELLTGRTPFGIPAFLLAVAEQPIPSPQLDAPGVSEELRALVGRALRSDPTERPSMRALRAALE